MSTFPFQPTDSQIEELLSSLSLPEKILTLGGRDAFFLRFPEKLGWPDICMADGPSGVRNEGPATAYPAPIGLAAAWNTDLARRFGDSLGRDARARGVHILLAPGVNIYRSPRCGRNFEYLGEDPVLAGVLAAAEMQGLHAQGVAATIKHFAANNQEYSRYQLSSDVEESVLREIYLRAFEIALAETPAWCVMGAYNPVNGVHASAHAWLNQTILKGEWGFAGVLMSDWHATHDALGAARGGLDLEMPAGENLNLEKLVPLLDNGEISEALIDDKIRRLLRLVLAFGWNQKEQRDDRIPKDDPSSRAVALDLARESIVLLKNEGGLLPLDRARRIVVVGPNAHPAMVGGAGSSRVTPFSSTSVLEGLQKLAGPDVEVVGIPWNEPTEYLDNSRFEGGVRIEYYHGRGEVMDAVPFHIETTDRIDLVWSGDEEVVEFGETVQARVFASVRAEHSGPHLFHLETAPGGVHTRTILRLDGQQLLHVGRGNNCSLVVDLVAGRLHRLEIVATLQKKISRLRFGWGSVKPLFSASEQETIRRGDAVVAVVGFCVTTSEGEAFDRPWALTGRQEEMLIELGKLNPGTVAILNAGGSISTDLWLAGIPAFLHAWYPGQEGGIALAEILLGRGNPCGKLPISFEKREEDGAAWGHYPTDEQPRNNRYEEGILAGYRWFDEKQIKPLYPFGHGLSYTTFACRDLELVATEDSVQVSLQVDNTGSRDGAEIVQVYLETGMKGRPVRELKGFGKVFLRAEESRRITIPIPRRLFSWWDAGEKRWKAFAGPLVIRAASSSRDPGLSGTLEF